MKTILVYTTAVCPYCVRAKQLLEKKGAKFQEIRVDGDSQLRAELIEKSGGKRTVPQIFIDDFHVGGCDDLYALEREGKLDALLAS